jgi:hypothetical protein
MPDPDTRLLALAEERVPADIGVRECWSFIVEGIKLGWLNPDKIRKLIEHIRQHEDYAIDELAFDELDDRLRVSFLDDSSECSPAAMIDELESLLAAWRQA